MTKRALNPGMRRTTLTIDQVKMILRIYWLDKAKRRADGYHNCSYRLYQRLAAQFKVSTDVIHRIADARDIQGRKSFKSVSVRNEQCKVMQMIKARVELANPNRTNA
jgi:hypothetical protein